MGDTLSFCGSTEKAPLDKIGGVQLAEEEKQKLKLLDVQIRKRGA